MATNQRSRRSLLLAVTGSFAVLALMIGSIAIILDDPEVPVDARIIEGVTASAFIATPSAATVSQSVDGLERLQGVLLPSDDVDEWRLGGLTIDVGPERWMRETAVESDLDGDGSIGTLLEELQGLSGRNIEIWVRFDNTRDDAELFAIEQTFIRDPTTEQPPWEGTDYDD
jgi:hypothetical protein